MVAVEIYRYQTMSLSLTTSLKNNKEKKLFLVDFECPQFAIVYTIIYKIKQILSNDKFSLLNNP